MPLANRETVVAYVHKMYGIRREKFLELLEEPELNDYLLLGELHDSFDYFVAEQIMDRLTEANRIPTEGTPEYEAWVDPEWTPSEDALLDCSELEEAIIPPVMDDEEDDNLSKEEAGPEEENEEEPDEEEDDDEESDEEDDEELDLDPDDDEAPPTREIGYASPSNRLSSGNFTGDFNALRAAYRATT